MGWVVNATPRPVCPRCPLCRRLLGPPVRSGRVRKISHPLGFDPRTVQPITSCHTDWAIPAHVCCSELKKYYTFLFCHFSNPCEYSWFWFFFLRAQWSPWKWITPFPAYVWSWRNVILNCRAQYVWVCYYCVVCIQTCLFLNWIALLKARDDCN
jgi:hypothetical protein